jgi:hypothetical protein
MILRLSIALLGATLFALPAAAQTAPPPAGPEEALAMQLANPIASLISVPFQFNYGFNSITTLTSVQWKTATE